MTKWENFGLKTQKNCYCSSQLKEKASTVRLKRNKAAKSLLLINTIFGLLMKCQSIWELERQMWMLKFLLNSLLSSHHMRIGLSICKHSYRWQGNNNKWIQKCRNYWRYWEYQRYGRILSRKFDCKTYFPFYFYFF